jgi:phosphate transport system substrate-binding protein
MNFLKLFIVFLCCASLVACSPSKTAKKQNDDTIISGTIRVSVDESLKPLMEAEFNVFGFFNPKASLTVTYKPEHDVLNDFTSDSASAIIVTRELTPEEMNYFKSIQYVPRSMPFAKDGISLIVNKKNTLDSFTVNELKLILTGKAEKNTNVVFDNSASSTVRWLKDSLLKTESLAKNCFTLQTNPEVIKYISEHENAIGIIGTSWISNLDDSNVVNVMKTVKRARIAAGGSEEYLEPFQSEIATGRYPLARTIYCIQRDEKVGLSSALQRFLYDEKGQIIVLKFGLMPYTLPERSLHFNE